MSAAAIVFWISLAMCAYVYVGYPALLFVLARLRARPVQRAPITPRISVIIPAHNEEAVIEEKLVNTLRNGYPADRMEVIVTSDGSTDRTEEIVRGFAGDGVGLLANPRRGKIPALNDAARAARGEVLVFTDADALLDPGALGRLAESFADPAVGGVAGRKATRPHPASGAVSGGEGLYTRLDEWQKKMEGRIGSVVGSDGLLHAVRRELYEPIGDPGVADDLVISGRVVLQGLRVVYEPGAVARSEASADPAAGFRRRVRIANHVMRALPALGKQLWSSPLFALQLLSHKLLRYVVPVFLLLMLVANVPLALGPSPFWRGVLLAQAVFYGLGVAGHMLRSTPSRKFRVVTIPYFFCWVNAAALVALFSLARGEHSGTWAPRGGFARG